MGLEDILNRYETEAVFRFRQNVKYWAVAGGRACRAFALSALAVASLETFVRIGSHDHYNPKAVKNEKLSAEVKRRRENNPRYPGRKLPVLANSEDFANVCDLLEYDCSNKMFLPYSYLCVTALGAFTAYAYLMNRYCKKSSGLSPVIEHNDISGIIAGLLAYYLTVKYIEDDVNFHWFIRAKFKVPVVRLPGFEHEIPESTKWVSGALMGIFAYWYISFTLEHAGILKNLKESTIKSLNHVGSAAIKNIFSKSSKEEMELLIRCENDPVMLAEFYLRDSQDAGNYYFQEGINRFGERRNKKKGFANKAFCWSYIQSLLYEIRKFFIPETRTYISRECFEIDDYAGALHEIDALRAVHEKKYGRRYDFLVNRALFIGKIAQEAEAHPENYSIAGLAKLRRRVGCFSRAIENEWSGIIGGILSDEKTSLVEVGGRVKAMAVSGFIGSTIVIKGGSRDELEDERNACLQAEAAVGEISGASVLRPLAVASCAGQSYYVLLYRASAKSLFEETDFSRFLKACEALRRIHECVRSAKGVRDYRRIVEQRILSSRFDFLKPVVGEPEWGSVWERAGAPVFDKDPHGGQWLSEPGMLYVIDFSDKGMVGRGFQLNKLIVESSLRGSRADELLAAYCPENDRIFTEYHCSMVPSAFSYMCVPVDKGMAPKEQAAAYLENAEASAGMMGLKKMEGYIKEAKEKI